MISLYEKILHQIFDGQFGEARSLIQAARERISSDELHRLTALAAVLEREQGNVGRAIELIRDAKTRAPTWLPHLYRLSVFLMEEKKWAKALTILDELISSSIKLNDTYFLDEARLRKIMCLKRLDKRDVAQTEAKEVGASTTAFIDGKLRGLDDLD